MTYVQHLYLKELFVSLYVKAVPRFGHTLQCTMECSNSFNTQHGWTTQPKITSDHL